MKHRFAISSVLASIGIAYGGFLMNNNFSSLTRSFSKDPVAEKIFIYSLDSSKKIIDSAVLDHGNYYANAKFQSGAWLGVKSPYNMVSVIPMQVLSQNADNKFALVKFHINEAWVTQAINRDVLQFQEKQRLLAEAKKKDQAEKFFELAMRTKGDTIHLADSLLRANGLGGLISAHQMGYTKKFQKSYINRLSELDKRITIVSDSIVSYSWSYGDDRLRFEGESLSYVPSSVDHSFTSPGAYTTTLSATSATTTSKVFRNTTVVPVGGVKSKAAGSDGLKRSAAGVAYKSEAKPGGEAKVAGATKSGGAKSETDKKTGGETATTAKPEETSKTGGAVKSDMAAAEAKKAEEIAAISSEFPAARQITAGHWNDIEHWSEFQKTHENNAIAHYQHRWGMNMTQGQQHLRLKSNGKPIVDATVSLYSNEGNLLWTAKSNNFGECVLYLQFQGELGADGNVNPNPIAKPIVAPSPAAAGKDGKHPAPAAPKTPTSSISPGTSPHDAKTSASTPLKAAIPSPGKTYYKLVISKGEFRYSDPKWSSKPVPGIIDLGLDDYKEKNSRAVDICMVVDATGSMGDEIQYLQSEMMDVILRAQTSAPCSKIRLGSVFYRDLGDNYVTVKKDFTESIEELNSFLGAQSAGGGGDFPEAVDSALATAINHMEWSEDALARILFLVLDAPPHDYAALRIRNLIETAAQKGIKIVPITASGINQETEFLMKYMAAATFGDYIYITNHSGIGSAHIAPTGVKENVDYLNDIMVNMIAKYCSSSDCDPQNNPNSIPEQKVEVFGDQDVQIQAYPNPAVSDLQIKASIKLSSVALVSTTGQVLRYLNNINNNIAYLSVSDLKPGIYHIRCSLENNSVYTTKIIAMPYGSNQNNAPGNGNGNGNSGNQNAYPGN